MLALFSLMSLILTWMTLGFAWGAQDPALSNRIRAHVIALTSSSTGRAPGTQGHKQAQSYLIGQMKDLGLTPSGLADPDDPNASKMIVKEYIRSSLFRQGLGFLLSLGFPMAKAGLMERQGYPVFNLIGVIKSKDPSVKKWRLIITHYDHLARLDGKLYPGALDNGSGVATHLETIRLIQQHLKSNPAISLPAHLMFAFTDREEVSNIGIALIGARLLKERIAKRWGNLSDFSVIAMDLLGVHMVEGGDLDLSILGPEDVEKNCGHFSAYFSSTNFHFICAPISILEGGRFPITLFPQDMLDRCDYAPFRDAGVRSLFLTSGSPWFYHTSEDKPERLDYEKLAALANSLSKFLVAKDLETLMTSALQAHPTVYSSETVGHILSFYDALLQARDFYPLLPKEIERITHNQRELLACQKPGCNQVKARQIVFDLLFILHQAGKRRIMEHG